MQHRTVLGSSEGRRRVGEALLVAAVMAPVALDPARRRLYSQLGLPYRGAVAAMVGASLAGHLVLSSRAFPFVDWSMYTKTISGDPVVIEYEAILASGRTVRLAFRRFLGTQSAGRLMEALRRQVLRIQSRPENSPERHAALQEHKLALRAIARRYGQRHPQDPVVSVLVFERTISIRDGGRSPASLLWEVPLP
jgi:hypothetical protein